MLTNIIRLPRVRHQVWITRYTGSFHPPENLTLHCISSAESASAKTVFPCLNLAESAQITGGEENMGGTPVALELRSRMISQRCRGPGMLSRDEHYIIVYI